MNIIEQKQDRIYGTLSTFDRVIIHGYLISFQNPRLMLYYLIQKKVKLVDFSKFAEQQTNTLCTHIENLIKKEGIELEFLKTSKVNKSEIAQKRLIEKNYKSGLIAAFSSLEICNIMTVVPNRNTKRLEINFKETKCKHYYLYYNHEELGFMFFKIQTTFPYNIGIYFNGREYLAKILEKEKIPFEMYNNSFSYIEDFEKAQQLANEIPKKKISDIFDKLVNEINPLFQDFHDILSHDYYWCIDQCEYAMDITFKKQSDLKSFYKKLVENTYFSFSSEDIYSFFGKNFKRVHLLTQGDITSDLRNRDQEFRIKFKLNSNQIKMYDKGNNLRIEVTINNPRDFKILKENENKEKNWIPMQKSIANLYRYAEINEAIIARFINALPEIDTNVLPLKDLEVVSMPKVVNGKTYPPFNVFNEETLKLFQIISNGKYLIHGFNNKMIREEFFEDSDSEVNIEKMTRLLLKLKAHKLIKKVPRKNQYYLTNQGRKIISSVLIFTHKELLN